MRSADIRRKQARHRQDAWTPHSGEPLTYIEYNIYSYSNDDSPRARWQKCACVRKPDSALTQAEELFRSGQYKKVEVKQKYFDLKTRRNIDETWRVLERGSTLTPSSKAILFSLAIALIAFAVAAGAGAL